MIICISFNKVKGRFIKYYKNFHFVIEKFKKPYIISTVIGASSNGRTRDFGSLYHGSNPCAPTIVNKMSFGAFFVWNTRLWRVRKSNLEKLSLYPHFRTFDFSGLYQHIYIGKYKFISIHSTKNFRTSKRVRIATIICTA